MKTSRRARISILARALSFALALEFSGIFLLLPRPALAKPPAPPVSAELRRAREIETLGVTVHNHLSSLLLKARAPQTLTIGKVDVAALRRDLGQVETDLLTLRQRIEADIAAPEARNPEAHDRHLLVTLFYFSQLATFAQVATLVASERPTADFVGPFAISVPQSWVLDLSGYNDLAGADASENLRQVLSDPNAAIVADFTKGDVVSLHLGRGFLRALRAKSYADHPTASGFLRIFKLLAVSALYAQLAEVRDLQDNPAAELPPLPATLQKQLGALDGFEEGRRETSVAAEDSMFREALLKKIPLALKQQNFADLAFTQAFAAQVVGSAQDVDTSLLSPLVQSAQAEEKKNLESELGKTLRFYPLPLLSQNLSTQREVLRTSLAKAKFLAFAPTLKNIAIPPERLGAVSQYLHASIAAAGHRYASAHLDQWLNDAREAARRGVRTDRQKAYVKNLLASSQELRRLDQGLPLDKPIKVTSLLRALTPDLKPLGLGTSGAQILALLLRETDFAKLTANYALTVKRLETAANPQGVPSGLDERKVESLRRDLTVLKKFGQWARLDQPRKTPPRLQELPLSETQQKNYAEVVRNETLGTSILTLPSDQKQPLYKVLALNPNDASGNHLRVQNALNAVEQHIRDALVKLGEAKTLDDLKVLGSRSAFLHQVLEERYPAFADVQARLSEMSIESIKSRSIYGDVTGDYAAPMTFLMPLFLTDLVTVFFRPTAPLLLGINRIKASLLPHVAGYMAVSLPIIVTDLGVAGWELHEVGSEVKTMKDFFTTSATASTFFDAFDIADGETRYNASELAFQVRVGSQLLFLGSPFAALYGKRFVLRMMDRWRLKQFEDVGFTGDTFPWDETAISAKARETIERIQRGRDLPAHKAQLTAQVLKAEKSLLQHLAQQRRELVTIKRDLAKSTQHLGLKDSDNLFDLDVLETALHARLKLYQQGRITERELKAAEAACEEIRRVVFTEVSFAMPGPLHSLASSLFRRGQANATSWTPSRESIVRLSLLDQVRGYANLAPKDNVHLHLSLHKDPYRILGVDPQSTDAQIKAAYRDLARKHHPDVNRDDPLADERFKEITGAWGILGDSQKRMAYDRSRRNSP